MIYVTEGNTPLNEAYNDEIVQEGNNTYQLTFRFPTSDPKWELLKEETFLTADDLHGEQDFYIFEIEKQQGYIQVYANQVISLLNNYIVSSIDVDRVSGTRVLSAFAGSITRANPFSFFSDIDDRHTLNIKDKNAMEVLAKDKHSILGQWGGDMVRNGYNLRLLKNGGSENESLFMYKKNLSSYQHKTSTKSLKTRITFKTTVKGEGEKAPDVDYVVVIDSPLLGKYSQIYEAVVEVNDQNVKDQASLIEYGKQYFRTSMCDMLEDNLEISVVGQSDVAVRMFDVVSIYHDWYGLDVRKKITKYTYSPMAKRLKSIGFGTFQSSLANAIGGIVNDAVLNESQNLHKIFEERLKKEIANADRAFDAEFAKREKDITDGIELAKAKAEEVKQELSDTISQRFDSFADGPLKEAKRKAEEALKNAGASSSLAQEAKRIGLDSVAKLEAFKSQTTSAQTALSGNLDALKRTIANDIRPKQARAEAEIAKQVEALNKTKNELAGVKSAQATYEETTTRRLSELTNLANGKASKSELTQTAEELASKIASVQVGGRNYIRGTRRMALASGLWTSGTFRPSGVGTAKTIDVSNSPATGFDKAIRLTSSNARDQIGIAQDRFEIMSGTYTMSVWVKGSVGQRVRIQTYWAPDDATGISPYFILKDDKWTYLTFSSERKKAGTVSIGYVYLVNADEGEYLDVLAPQLENGSLATSPKEAPEDTDGQISAVESTFKQRADSLDAGVRSLTEGLRTKADISALNVTAENIRQSVKNLETDTQNKLNQKLSLAEFEVRAGSIRQEILNATKDKADKTLVITEAGKLREEFSKMKVGSRNYAEDYDFSRGLWYYIQGDNSPQDWTISNGEYNVKGTTNTWKQMQIFSKEGSIVSGKSSTALLELELGETYTLSFQGICYSGNPSVWVSLRANRTVPGNPGIIYDSFNLTSSWQTYQVTIPALTKPDNFDFWRIILGYNEIGHVAFRKVELTRSSTRIDAGPAPEDGKTDLVVAKSEFQKTAEGLSAKLASVENYVSQDGQRQEALQRYSREESARQATAVRELVTRDFVGKSAYQEDVKGINQKIESVKTSANKEIASQIASYRQSVDGKFTDISSQITTYKQDVGGQISGLSNRLTSSEQGTTTQISNLSNRINSNKQGTDTQISNLTTQVATNKDNAERQMGRISDQVSANKVNADSQFANVSNQLARKVETTDFQRVKETSQLYERIIGTTEDGIADKVARMAMTNQLFQVEVAKAAKGGRNYIRNGQFKNGSKNWLEYQSVNFGLNFNYQHSQNPNNRNRPGLHFYHESQDVANYFGIQQSFAFDGVQGEKVSVSLLVSKDGGDSNSGLKVALHYIKNKNIVGQEWQSIPSPQITSKYKRFTFTFTLSDDVENLNLMLYGEKGKTINLYLTDVQLERGSVATDYKEAPEDTEEAVRTVQRQLDGSWSVQNINSAGDIISGINLGANGHNRITGKLTHITGETLIDNAVIKSAMIDKLKTGNFEAGSVTTTILGAEAVTADKLKVDFALVRKLTANDAFIEQLTSKRIFSTKVESVVSSSTFLEAYQGRIGGFTLGQFDYGGGRWISGVNQFSVGMGNGAGYGVKTAFWANWGNSWDYAGPKAWYVNTDGKMYCRNEAGFYDQVDFSNSSSANFYGNTTFSRSPVFSNGIELGSKDVFGDGWNPKGGRNAVVWWNQVGSGSVKYWMEQKSDRRLKENITDTAVKALDKINRLKMVSFDFIESKKHEEIGLIAQEVETIVPRVVSRDPENPDGYLHIDYTAFVPYLIKAIQELNQKINLMEEKYGSII
jgi:phage minor structural protein